MSNRNSGFDSSIFWKKLIQYFFQGLVIIAPVGITIYVVLWLFNMVDDILPNIIHFFFPDLIRTDAEGYPETIPGLGFVVVILAVLIVGKLSSSFVLSKIVYLMDSLLERAPGIKFIYKSIKDFLEAFTGNKRKFDRPVLVSVDGPDVWRIGFITQDDVAGFDLNDHAVVYIPLSYTITGITYFVPRDKIKLLNNISSGEAMKFALSGGVSQVE